MLTPQDGMRISVDTSLAGGVYYLPGGLVIDADGVTLGGGGAWLLGSGSGRGLTVRGRGAVTIRNLRLAGYYHNIYAEACAGLTIAGCTARASAEEPANTLFLDIWRPAAQAYGAGVMLVAVRDGLLIDCDLQHQQNGLLCYAGSGLIVRRNVANHCSGAGFHFFATNDCLIEDNYADFCCRYQPRSPDHGHLGADAAGFLIVHGSCRNLFRRNRARLGGDGFFLAGLRPDWTPVPCDENVFEQNDGSYSPNIAFEATFSRGNIFRGNRADGCNYGFWLGFSRENLLEGNHMSGNRAAGVAVENGIACTVRDNDFVASAYGLLLWSKYVEPFARTHPANDTSRDWLISGNRFSGNRVAVRIAADQDHGVRPLPPHTPRCPRPQRHTLRANQFHNNQRDIELIDAEEPLLEANRF